MQGVKEDLALAIEAYTAGEEPSVMELHCAPRLDEWEVLIRRRGKEFVLVITGIVSKHPDQPDGSIIASGAIVWLDRHHRWARSHRRLWALGKQGGEPIPIDGIYTDEG
ncbi:MULTISPECIES: hypothetical protein [unclassified Bradyrhizobium]|uniref:hypothetical protein n=1 Tax=unclassified Bradyrhizobium TaxID=2631580 RepID=UPI001FFBB02F|nr:MULTISPECIES: hypothetical protein [unclassified Bradyrhizobium]MCK1540331.1 hypothetical protein [Bradyrhizobium sp. 176]MCK1556173.1 hypothetical protein [Bradyrhizobium sp. 171]